jgi:uncharacterized delta-60 repeat protein
MLFVPPLVANRLACAGILVGLIFCTPARAQVGSLDPTFDAGAITTGAANGTVHATLVTSTKAHLIAGSFSSVGGVARGNIAKLDQDGSIDSTFGTGAGANGPIYAMALDTSGRILIGGDFTTYDGIARNRIARLTASGALDFSFDPGSGFDGAVYTIAQGIDIYVGGDFSTFNGEPRNRLATIHTSGAQQPGSFGGGANGAVRVLVYHSRTGAIYAGGDFTSIGSATRGFFAQFTSSGSLTGSNLSFNGSVRAIHLPSTYSSTETSLVVGGDFTSVGGVPRGRLAAFSMPTWGGTLSLDSQFNFWLDAPCRSVRVLSNTKIILGGDFTTINGRWRSRFASILRSSSTSGGSSSSYWDLVAGYGETGPDGPVHSVALDSDGRPLLGGAFSGVPPTTRNAFLRLYGDAGSSLPATPTSASAVTLSDTQIHISWSASALASSYALESSPDGVTGWVQVYSGTSTSFTQAGLTAGTQRFYRVSALNYNGPSSSTAPVSATTNPDAWTGSGSVQSSLPPGSIDGSVSEILRLTDGKIIIAGSFSNVLGSPRKYIARLLPDLTLDQSFDPGQSANSAITQIEPAPNGGVYIYGDFSTFAGATRNDVARLTASGSLDLTFDTNAEWTFSDGIRAQPDGRLIVFGNFQTFFGTPRDYIARLNLDGSIDTSFVCVPDWMVDAVALQTDGKLLVAGWFRTITGIAAKNFARVLANGLPDSTFAGSATTQNISSLVSLATGQHYAAGSFTQISGVDRRYISRLNQDGTVDATFDPGLSTGTTDPLLFPQPNGKLIVSGPFNSVASNTRWKMARLNSDGSVDASFNAEAGPGGGAINSVVTLPDGSLLVGGTFTNFGATTHSYLVQLKGDEFTSTPSTPVNLTSEALSSSSILLRWDQLPNEYSWKVERSPAGANSWQLIAEVAWDSTSFADTNLPTGTSYDYRVRAWNAAGDSPYSSISATRTLNQYEQWKVDRNLPVSLADDHDGDADGVGLFLEYALGLNPSIPDGGNLPTAQILGGGLALTYAKARPELSYLVESSTNLTDWSPTNVNQGVGLYPTAWVPAGSEPRLFLRLRVAQ